MEPGERARKNVVSTREIVERSVRAVLDGLSEVVDRAVVAHRIRCASARRRPSGPGTIHISFRFVLEHGECARQGCLLLPLSQSLVLAAQLLYLPDELVACARTRQAPDVTEKEALLELSAVVASGLEHELASFLPEIRARSAGCQGVRAGVRPSLAYREGDELWVATFEGEIDDSGSFLGHLVLPSLTAGGVRPAFARRRAARRAHRTAR
jgi:hypothetical protein